MVDLIGEGKKKKTHEFCTRWGPGSSSSILGRPQRSCGCDCSGFRVLLFFPFHVGMRRVSASSAEGAVLCLAQWKAAGYK